MKAPRVIFDRSAFSGDKFELLRNSNLKALCRVNKLRVCHTYIFLEETLNMYSKPDRRERLQDEISFIVEICNGGYFHDRMTIWDRELVQNLGIHAPIFLFKQERQEMETALQGGVTPEAWRDTVAAREERFSKSQAQREVFVEIRKELPQLIKGLKVSVAAKQFTFGDYCKREIDHVGRSLIGSELKRLKTKILENRWLKDTTKYPYVTEFIRGFLFAGYYAGLQQNVEIDRNAQADYQLLTHLNNADIVVSADERFLKYAFDALWAPIGKRLYTPSQFVDWISKLTEH